MRGIVIAVLTVMLFTADIANAQTDTPVPTETFTPTPTLTPTPEPYVHMTVIPPDGTPDGQMTRFDYTATAGDVHIANLLTFLLYSFWAMFLFLVVVTVVLVRRR